MDTHAPDAAPPGMYCRKCGYVLAGLSENRCPECGLPFEPADPRTFRRKPPLSGLRLWTRRLVLAAAVLAGGFLLLEVGVTFWYYRGWRVEQSLIARIRADGGQVDAALAAPRWALRLLNRPVRFVAERVCRVEITGAKLDDALLRRLHDLPELGHLGLTGSTICKDGLRHLEGARKLRVLVLMGCPIDGAGLEHLKDLPELRMLWLLTDVRVPLPKPDYHFLAGLQQVEAAWISTPLEDGDLQYVSQMTGLRQLRLSSESITDEGLARLAGLTQLRRLDLAGTPVTGSGLAALGGMTALESLNLASTRVTDEGLSHIRTLANLETLWLGGTRLTDAGLPSLSGLSRLLILNLRDTMVSDAGLACLSPLAMLRELDLSGTQVTNQGLSSLKPLAGLRHLNLSHTAVTAEGVSALKARMPMVDVLWLPR